MSTILKFKKNKGCNRQSLDIVRDMLIVALIRVRKTRIMYQANLSYVQVKKYLHELLENGLLKCDGDSCYLTTKKGLEFLKMYEDYVARCKVIKDQVNKSAKDRILLERMCSCGGSSGAQKAR